jgi:hypothetical protein
MEGSSASHVELCPDWLLCRDELLVATCVVVLTQGKPELTRSFLRVVPSKREEKVIPGKSVLLVVYPDDRAFTHAARAF